jgi:hypothetical protein
VAWLNWLYDDPYSYGRFMIAYLTTVFVLSTGLALFRRKMGGLGAAGLAAAIGTVGFFFLWCAVVGFGPLFAIGVGFLFINGLLVALLTVGAIRFVLARKKTKT